MGCISGRTSARSEDEPKRYGAPCPVARNAAHTLGRMRIAIVSDTHLPRFGRVLPRWLAGTLEAAPWIGSSTPATGRRAGGRPPGGHRPGRRRRRQQRRPRAPRALRHAPGRRPSTASGSASPTATLAPAATTRGPGEERLRRRARPRRHRLRPQPHPGGPPADEWPLADQPGLTHRQAPPARLHVGAAGDGAGPDRRRPAGELPGSRRATNPARAPLSSAA